MIKTAILFPGQGAQLAGMGADVAKESERGARVFEIANEVLDFDLRSICFEGPVGRLACTDIQQPAIVATGIAILEAMLESGVSADQFSAAAGLSLGEYTALYFAGSLSMEDAIRLVYQRGQLMQQAADAVPSGMVSLIGADETQAQALCDQVKNGEVLVTANFNCPGQVVISGSQTACNQAVKAASDFGCKAIPLKVAGAFHSPLMQSAADALGEVLAHTDIKKPNIPVLSNVTACPHGAPDEIRRSLTEQVTHPVRWQQSMQRLIADGYSRFVEVGPNRVLTGLMRKINRDVDVVNVSTMDDVRRSIEMVSA